MFPHGSVVDCRQKFSEKEGDLFAQSEFSHEISRRPPFDFTSDLEFNIIKTENDIIAGTFYLRGLLILFSFFSNLHLLNQFLDELERTSPSVFWFKRPTSSVTWKFPDSSEFLQLQT